MKKTVLAFLGITLILSMLLASFGTVKAAPSGDDPEVMPVSGDLEFTTTVLNPSSLPGTVKNAAEVIFPVGFPVGEMQFKGNGILVKGFDSGTARACFSFPTYRYGWVGSVYQWTGSKWSKLTTSITEDVEGSSATACADIHTSGTYALITNYKGNAVAKEIQECVDIEFIWPNLEEGEGNRYYILGGDVYPPIPVGTLVSYELLNITPVGSLTGNLYAEGYVDSIGPAFGVEENPDAAYVVFPRGTYIDYSENWADITFKVRFYTMGCYKDFDYPFTFNGNNQ
jgi:hypothetical protein